MSIYDDTYGSLFDDAAAGLAPRTASEEPTFDQQVPAVSPVSTETFDDEWGFDGLVGEAVLHEEPEPALPQATAEEESPADEFGMEPTDLDPVVGQRAAALLAQAEAAARGEAGADNPYAHLLGSRSDNEMAAAAQAFLGQKAAVRTFTKAEQQQVIDEGLDAVAGNLDRLDIRGTHYEALERTASLDPAPSEDMDFTFLGDPNG